MKRENFEMFIDKEMIPLCLRILKVKGKSYSGDEDAFKNFKETAKEAGITVEESWLTQYLKHYNAIRSFLNDEYTDSEPIKLRIADAINYLLMLSGILREQGKIKGEMK